MWKSFLLPLFAASFITAQVPTPNWDTNQWNKTRTIKELPFCAMILREFHDTFDGSHTIHILMEPDEVSENNLRLLFSTLSHKDPSSPSLHVLVETDIERLAALATGEFTADVSPKRNRRANGHSSRIWQWAIYRRNAAGEFFRYNPDYPKADGFKTILLWGKEQL